MTRATGRFGSRVRAVAALGFGFISVASAATWEETVTASSPPRFPPPRPVHATYRFGWSGFTAATAEARLSQPSPNRFQLDGAGHTVGLVRALWKFDANHTSIADATTLHPLEVTQIEKARSKKIVTNLSFDSTGVTSRRLETPSKNPAPKIRRFDFPHLFDLQSALLYLRSQPMPDRGVQRIVVYPATSAYLATVTVLGREHFSGAAGAYNAIKLDLQLSKIGKNRELEPHRKFRRGTIWISDDSDRLLLRIEAQVFVGTVFAELQSVQFDDVKPPRPPE
ncbi:MAG TPA: DUF3108 domain-containing protein [Chthoniobacterales bacterium]|jgi:hypothetical protein